MTAGQAHPEPVVRPGTTAHRATRRRLPVSVSRALVLPAVLSGLGVWTLSRATSTERA
ncbi:hypothetical protein [Streptomyces sp. NPDC101237]|uniref:hypothetical protein n=1 Tax=Streptomyces sp. NPDC101237 TaxID=3366139 RepID=UPI0038284D26